MTEKRITVVANQFFWSNRCRFVTLTYAANPETFNFAPESSSWTDSAWHLDVIGEDPRRGNFVAAVKSVGKELKGIVNTGFNGDLDGWRSDIALNFE